MTRDGDAHPDRPRSLAPRQRHPSDQSLHHAKTTHLREALNRKASTRVQAVHRSGLPFVGGPGWHRSSWAFPRALHPAITRSAHRGRTGDLARTRNIPLCHRPRLQTSVVYSKRATSRRTRDCRSDAEPCINVTTRWVTSESSLARERRERRSPGPPVAHLPPDLTLLAPRLHWC
jgi:hypothetical protein